MTVAPQDLIYWVGMAAVAVTAVTAVLETEDKGMDLVGAIIVGLAAGLGGGTLRDLLLTRPVFWLGDPAYLVCGLVAVAATFVVARRAAPRAAQSSDRSRAAANRRHLPGRGGWEGRARWLLARRS